MKEWKKIRSAFWDQENKRRLAGKRVQVITQNTKEGAKLGSQEEISEFNKDGESCKTQKLFICLEAWIWSLLSCER